MSSNQDAMQSSLQAKLFDFALVELVHQHRNSFQPLWTIDSWVKFLIWLALNSGLSGERESLEIFSQALGSPLTSRMRRLFFERHLENLSIQLMADPADAQVLALPINGELSVSHEAVAKALVQAGLHERVVMDHACWEVLEAVIAIPWLVTEITD